MARRIYVYRLDVTLPEEAADPLWEPASWQPEWDPNPESDQSFRWPRHDRLWLSRSGAKGRADLLRSYGAKVEIVRSREVVFDG
jgi:hypothetical protein